MAVNPKPFGTISGRGLRTIAALLLAPSCAPEPTATAAPPATTAAQPAASSPGPAASSPGPAASSPGPAASPTFAVAVETTSPARTGLRCRQQAAQDFLLRKGQIAKIGASASEQRAIEAARKRSVDYRTREYGRFPGFGSRRDNPRPPSAYAQRTTFMGMPLVLHGKIVPALRCVESALLRDCTSTPYAPRQVTGLRFENTFKDYEVSNHVYGIALDIDSHDNPCCGCVGSWSQHPACRKKVASVYERMAMPRCWVEVFERYGFYWLGHDELEDTMHFEFLGDPALISE